VGNETNYLACFLGVFSYVHVYLAMQAYHRVKFACAKSSQKSVLTTAHQAAHCGADTVNAATAVTVTAGSVQRACSEMCMFKLRQMCKCGYWNMIVGFMKNGSLKTIVFVSV
jgi:hypothetical protein